MKIQPGKTINKGEASYVHEPLFEIIETDTGINLNYIAFCCTNLKKEKINVVVYTIPLWPMTKTSWGTSKFFFKFVVRRATLFFVGDMNINLLGTSAIGNKYLNSLKLN